MQAMVIEDSKTIRHLLTRFLNEMGLDVVHAENGQEALEQLESHPDIELALVDWNMPVMNGLDFVIQVRKQPVYSGIRLMMVTTETETTQIIHALEAGADEYVMKPFDKDMIERKLALMGIETE